ncbi:hypothetical protein CHUAL_002838 [Chamberlinius hualienensis]
MFYNQFISLIFLIGGGELNPVSKSTENYGFQCTSESTSEATISPVEQLFSCDGSEVEIESYQHMKYKSALSVLSRGYLQQQGIDAFCSSETWATNQAYLPYVCAVFLQYLSQNNHLDHGVLFYISANRMTLGQLYALNSTVSGDLHHGIWTYDDMYEMPVGFYPLIPSDEIYKLNDNEVLNLLHKFNAAADRLLHAQKARLVKKLMTVSMWTYLGPLDIISCTKPYLHAVIPAAQILTLIPLNYFRQFNYLELYPFLSDLPINSPQTMLFAQVLEASFTKDTSILSDFKVLLSLSTYHISKLNPLRIKQVLQTLSSMPEPYTVNYEMARCLHKKYVEYLNITYADGKSADEDSLMFKAADEDHETAGGIILAYFSTQAWNSLPKNRCLKLISIIGELSIVRLMMVQPSQIVTDLINIAFNRMNVIDGWSFDNNHLKLLGNLINYIHPKFISGMEDGMFEITMPYLHGIQIGAMDSTAFVQPCHEDLFVIEIHKKLTHLYGDSGTWTKEIVAKVSCLLYVLDYNELLAIKNEYLADNANIVHDCWYGIKPHPDYDQISSFYSGLCMRNLGYFYYVVKWKVNKVLNRFKNAILEVARLEREEKSERIQLQQDSSDFVVGVLDSDACCGLCSAVQDVGSVEFWTIDEINELNENDFRNCLDFMGARYLPANIANKTWQRLVQVVGPPETLEKATLMQLGSIVRGIPDNDFSKLKLDADIFGEFGNIDLWTVDDYSKLKAIAREVKRQYKDHMAYYTSWDFILLGQINCGFTIRELESICNVTFADAISVFSQLDCPHDVMTVFARKVVNNNLFGSPSSWGPGVLNAVGTILSGLTLYQIRSIPACAFYGISSRAAITLPLYKYMELSQYQLEAFPPEAVAALHLFGSFEGLDVDIKDILQLAFYNNRYNCYKFLEECYQSNWQTLVGSVDGDEKDVQCYHQQLELALASKGVIIGINFYQLTVVELSYYFLLIIN